MMNDRLDDQLEAAVNRGIAAILLFGVKAGVKVMQRDHVPSHIITRIILDPKSHRSSDWKIN